MTARSRTDLLDCKDREALSAALWARKIVERSSELRSLDACIAFLTPPVRWDFEVSENIAQVSARHSHKERICDDSSKDCTIVSKVKKFVCIGMRAVM